MSLKIVTKEFVEGKTVLYRAPYDIGFTEQNGVQTIKDTSRIDVTIPTLKFLLDQNCKIVVLTWVKRPEGKDPKLSTKPLAEKLEEIIKSQQGYENTKVCFVDDCIGEKVENAIKALNPKEILMLENVRYYKEDLKEDLDFATKLCKGSEVVVFDAFPQSHREASSVTGILKVLPSVAGLYMSDEVLALTKLRDNPTHPFTLMVGGAKISDKILAVKNLIEKCELAIIGGGTSHILLRELGYNLGKSLVEDSFLDDNKNKLNTSDIAKELLSKYKNKILLPTDLIVTDINNKTYPTRIVDLSAGPLAVRLNDSESSLDIGPKSIDQFKQAVLASKTVFWNGPLGAYDLDTKFTTGTNELAKTIAQVNGTTIVSGGDTIDAIKALNIENKITHISVAGGATLEFLAGLQLPALKLLS